MISLCYCCSQGGLSLILRLIRLHQKSQEVNPAIIRKYLGMRDISLLVRACKYNAITLQIRYNYQAIQIQCNVNTNTNTCKYRPAGRCSRTSHCRCRRSRRPQRGVRHLLEDVKFQHKSKRENSLTFNAGDPLRELLHTEKVFEDVLACLVRLPFALQEHVDEMIFHR